MTVGIHPLSDDDRSAAEHLLDAELSGRWQARLGELVDVLALPGFVATDGGRLVGVATFDVTAQRAELAAIVVTRQHRRAGLGSALLEAVVAAAQPQGAREIWLLTTNDNVDALRFYQRRGFHLAAVHVGGVDRDRRLKPSIPDVGLYGIAIRDELILVRRIVVEAGEPRTSAAEPVAGS